MFNNYTVCSFYVTTHKLWSDMIAISTPRHVQIPLAARPLVHDLGQPAGVIVLLPGLSSLLVVPARHGVVLVGFEELLTAETLRDAGPDVATPAVRHVLLGAHLPQRDLLARRGEVLQLVALHVGPLPGDHRPSMATRQLGKDRVHTYFQHYCQLSFKVCYGLNVF